MAFPWLDSLARGERYKDEPKVALGLLVGIQSRCCRRDDQFAFSHACFCSYMRLHNAHASFSSPHSSLPRCLPREALCGLHFSSLFLATRLHRTCRDLVWPPHLGVRESWKKKEKGKYVCKLGNGSHAVEEKANKNQPTKGMGKCIISCMQGQDCVDVWGPLPKI